MHHEKYIAIAKFSLLQSCACCTDTPMKVKRQLETYANH